MRWWVKRIANPQKRAILWPPSDHKELYCHRAITPPPLVKATQKSHINTAPTPTVPWTRPLTPGFKKRRLHGELAQEKGI